MPRSQTSRVVIGWLLIAAGALCIVAVGFCNPYTPPMQLLFSYAYLYGLAVLAIVLGLVMQVD